MSTRVITGVSNDPLLSRQQVEVISVATTLTAADSGKIFLLSAAAGKVVTLPALQSGLNFKFVTALAFATDNWVIDSAEGDNIEGIIVVDGASVPAVAEDQINFVATAESLGDFVEFNCNGSKWYVSGVGALAGSITATDPS